VINSYTSSGDAEVAIAGARAGADVVRSMYGQWLPRIDKAAGDFATAADVAAEEVILDVIRAARPGDAVLGEEGGHQGAADAVRRWLVDPLCGTLNYAVGTMVVAVNVALRDGAAAVADPFGGEVFFTMRYTTRDGFLVGRAPTRDTARVDRIDRVRATARWIVRSDAFRGPGHSEGESWLHTCAHGHGSNGSGNAETWNRVGHIQHMSFVVNEIVGGGD
jgi:hypothetical protein